MGSIQRNDRVRDTTTTTGTGAITLSGNAPATYQNFSAVMVNTDTAYICISSQTTTEWEVSFATYSSANTLTRTLVLAGSNGTTAVTFSAGTKDVILVDAADFVRGFRTDNILINAACEVSQENGTTAVVPATGVAKYIVDQWGCEFSSAALAFQGQQVTPPGSPAFGTAFDFAVQLKATTGGTLGSTATNYAQIFAPIEGYRMTIAGFGNADAIRVYIGFWVYATIAGTMAVCLQNAAGNRSFVREIVINSPTTWEYKTLYIPGDTAGTWLTSNAVAAYLQFTFGSGTTVETTADSWQASAAFSTVNVTNFYATNLNVAAITGVYMGLSQAPTQERNPTAMRTFDEELQLCQRYYEKSYDYATAPGTVTTNGWEREYCEGLTSRANQRILTKAFRVRKRATPTMTTYSSNSGTSGKVWDTVTPADITPAVNGYEQDYDITMTMGSIQTVISFGWQWVANARL